MKNGLLENRNSHYHFPKASRKIKIWELSSSLKITRIIILKWLCQCVQVPVTSTP